MLPKDESFYKPTPSLKLPPIKPITTIGTPENPIPIIDNDLPVIDKKQQYIDNLKKRTYTAPTVNNSVNNSVKKDIYMQGVDDAESVRRKRLAALRLGMYSTMVAGKYGTGKIA